MNQPVRIQLVLPFHQPLSASPEIVGEVLEQRYLPLLDAIAERRDLRVALHFGGHLLDVVTRTHESLLFRLRDLAAAGHIEVLGGLFYGGVPALLPELDIRGQLEMSLEYWESYLGAAPRGFWLPDLAWSVEMPRLLQDMNVDYGFVSQSQLAPATAAAGLRFLQRGEQRVAAFVLDPVLSQTFGQRPADEWVDALLDRASRGGGGVRSVWTSVEALAQSSHLSELLDALGGARSEVQTVLPCSSYAESRLVRPAELVEGRAPELDAGSKGVAQWTDQVRSVPELRTLYARMLHASEKLREAIAAMEDEGNDEAWSDTLATAQRMLFSAQSYELYWRSNDAVAAREAAIERLIHMDVLVDGLVQGTEDWLALEEEDRDGDFADEVWVATPKVAAWLVPAQGALVRTLDDRPRHRDLLDITTEPTSHRAPPASAPQPDATLVDEAAARLGQDDALQGAGRGHGIRLWVLDHRASPLELFGGSALDLTPVDFEWAVESNGIEEEGDPRFVLTVGGTFALEGLSARTLAVTRSVVVPIDRAEIGVRYTAELEGAPEVLLATEIPLRLASVARLHADGEAVTGWPEELSGITTVRVTGEEGEAVTVQADAPCDWWLSQPQGRPNECVLVAVMRAESAFEGGLTVGVG